jgi:phage gp29-like protein
MLYFARKGIRDLNDQLEVYRQFPTAVGDYEEAPQQKNREDLLFV